METENITEKRKIRDWAEEAAYVAIHDCCKSRSFRPDLDVVSTEIDGTLYSLTLDGDVEVDHHHEEGDYWVPPCDWYEYRGHATARVYDEEGTVVQEFEVKP